MTRIGGTTRIIAILGDPVEHSRSPAMHNAAFAALGLDYVYVAMRVRPRELEPAMMGVRAMGLTGLNITVPHKQAIVPLLDHLSPAARAIGAVNTIVRRGDRLEGDNTDAEGFLRAVGKLGFCPRGKTAVLLGAGGSARAIGWALARAGIARLTVLNRSVDHASDLAQQIRRWGNCHVEIGSLHAARRSEVVRTASLVVNSTSLGLDGKTVPPVAITATPRQCLFYDLVYGTRETPFVRLARRHGRRAEDGLGMLLEQAGLAFRVWTRRAPPLAVMGRALSDTAPD